MEGALSIELGIAEQDQRISDAMAGEQFRLRNFIRQRVADEGDVEDILQEVFYELVETYRLLKPVEQVAAWLFRVARNRITDLFRKKKPQALEDFAPVDPDGEALSLEELLPSPDCGPDAEFARGVLLQELEAALDELPDDQREVFIAHEIDGQSFKEIAAATGVRMNTLLSRKHYAVVHLRERLRSIYDESKKG